MLIYKITNKINGKVYVGQTRQALETRWSQHIKDSRRGGTKFYNAIQKYGKDNFVLEEIEQITSIDLLNEREIHWIKYHDSMNTGYNGTSGGEQLKQLSQETLRKKSEIMKGNKLSLGRKHTEDSIEKMKAKRALQVMGTPWNKGKAGVYSEEVLEKMRKSHQNRPRLSEEERKKRRSQSSLKCYYKKKEKQDGLRT